jgi:hypothetical protein
MPNRISVRYPTFEEYMRAVDAAIASKVGGMDSNDLPDYCYRDAYDDGEGPASVARKAIRAAGDY